MSDAARRTPTPGPIVAFFDVDNTLMRGASVFYVGREAWRRRLISFRDIAVFAWHQFRFLAVGENRQHLAHAKERALGLVGGHTEEALVMLANDIYEKDILPNLWPETVALTREHLAQGHEVWLITATPEIVAQVIAERLGLTGALGTVSEIENGVYTGRLVGAPLHGKAKAEAVRALADREGLDLVRCTAYSDSANDVPMLSVVGRPAAVNPDFRLRMLAKTHRWPVLDLRWRRSVR